MAYEQVGDGRSVGVLPNYADKYEGIQQGLANRFDQYTNPFLLARNISGVFQPGIQDAQHQQQLGISQQGMNIEQARQDMAKTAQDTLLPLQANQLTAQTANMTAQAARINFGLDTEKSGLADVYGLASDLANANASDPSSAYAVIGNHSAAAATPAGQAIINRYLQNSDRVSQIRTAAVGQNALQTGSDDVFNDKYSGMSATDYASSLTQNPGESDADFAVRKLQQPTGFAKAQTQHQQAIFQAQNTLALANARAGKTVQVAALRALGQGLKSGMVSPDFLEQQASGLSTAALNAANGNGSDFTPDPNAIVPPISQYPEPIQAEAIKNYHSIMGNPQASEQQRQQAAAELAVVSPALAQQLGKVPVYDPVTSARLKALDSSDMIQQKIIDGSSADPSLLKAPSGLSGELGSLVSSDPDYNLSPVEKAQKVISANAETRALIMQKQAGATQAQSQGSISIPTPSATWPPQNQFAPSGGSLNIGGVPSAPLVVPGNPQTTTALNATMSTGSNGRVPDQFTGIPMNKTLNVAPASSPLPTKDMQIAPAQVPRFVQWLKANPYDPRAGDVRAKLIANGVRGI